MQKSINCSQHDVYYIPIIYLFYKWKFVPFDSLHSFCHLPPSPLATASVFSVSVSYLKIPFSIMPSKSSMLSYRARFHSFLWLINILCVHVYMYIYLLYPFIFFIPSPIDGHLGCFNIIALVNNATMNRDAYIFSN